MTHILAAREYKLLLDPEHFTAADIDKAAARFWEGRLVKIIAGALGRRNGEPRHTGRPARKPDRDIRLHDTRGGGLDAAGLTLRVRTEADDPGGIL